MTTAQLDIHMADFVLYFIDSVERTPGRLIDHLFRKIPMAWLIVLVTTMLGVLLLRWLFPR